MCVPFLNGSNGSIKRLVFTDHNLENLARKMRSQILVIKGGEQFLNLGWGKVRGRPEFFQNPRGDESLTHCH